MVWLVALAFGLQSQEVATSPPISVDRVRVALARPSRLDVTVPEPAVHFHIEVRSYYKPIPLPPLWQLHPGEKSYTPSILQTPGFPGSPALFQIDLAAIGQSIGRAISSARRAHAEQAAREEVERAMREFCAAHPCSEP